MNINTSRVTQIVFSIVISACAQISFGQYYYLAQELISPSVSTNNYFGASVTVHNQFIAVGTFQDDVSDLHDGRINLFDTNTGNYLRSVFPPTRNLNGGYGWDVAIEDDLMLVGSYSASTVHGASGSGFLHNINTGNLITEFVTQIGDPEDQIGWSVAMEAPLALLGAPGDDESGLNSGAVYAFATTLLFEITKIKPNVPIANERFGGSVAIKGDFLVIGAPGFGGPETGSVYVFDVKTGIQLRRIVAADLQGSDYFGYSVDINIESGTPIIAIGAPLHDSAGPSAGAVYLYNAATGGLIRKITSVNPQTGDWFGHTVAIENETLVVGALRRDASSFNSGSFFVYDNILPGGNPDEIDEIIPFSIPTDQQLGFRVDINNGNIVGSGIGAGSAEGYATILRKYCDADINNDGELNFFDISAFIKFGIDFNGDGQFNFFDISGFLNLFNAGCS